MTKVIVLLLVLFKAFFALGNILLNLEVENILRTRNVLTRSESLHFSLFTLENRKIS